eukprot:2211644-Prymnesium_polylepis.1
MADRELRQWAARQVHASRERVSWLRRVMQGDDSSALDDEMNGCSTRATVAPAEAAAAAEPPIRATAAAATEPTLSTSHSSGVLWIDEARRRRSEQAQMRRARLASEDRKRRALCRRVLTNWHGWVCANEANVEKARSLAALQTAT